jgi:O-antigen/teichoic acid export membrane protein
MQKKFISNLVLIVVLNLLVKPLAIFGIDATVQNRVGAEEYGMYFSILNFTYLFNILADLGINNFTTKNIAQYPHIASRYIGKIFSFRLILFTFYAIVTLSIGVGIGYRGTQLNILYVLIFNQLLITFIAYFRSHFGGLHLFKTDALLSVLDRLLLIIICGSVLISKTFGQSFQIEWFVWIQTICYGITFMVAFVLLVRKIGIPKFKFNWVFSMAILRQSYPYALMILLMMIYTRTDSVMLERIHPNGKFEAGIYAQGFRLFDAFFMFGMIFTNLLFPVFSRLLKTKRESVFIIVNTSRNLLIGGAILLAFISFQNAEFILNFIYKNNISESVLPFQWLMWSFIGVCLSFIYGTLLTANGNMKFMNQLSLVGIVLNIILNALLIPKYGASGSAFATLITQSFTALIQLIYCHQLFSIKVTISQVINYSAFILLMFLIPFISVNHTLLFSLQIGLGILGLVLFKFIDIKALKIAFKENL